MRFEPADPARRPHCPFGDVRFVYYAGEFSAYCDGCGKLGPVRHERLEALAAWNEERDTNYSGPSTARIIAT